MDARLTSASPAVAGLEPTLRLTDLRPGSRGRLLAAHLERNDLALLHALGLAERSSFRLCKAGDPWIVQVRGTRIGISQHVAELLQVEPETEEAAAGELCECVDECLADGSDVDETLG